MYVNIYKYLATKSYEDRKVQLTEIKKWSSTKSILSHLYHMVDAQSVIVLNHMFNNWKFLSTGTWTVDMFMECIYYMVHNRMIYLHDPRIVKTLMEKHQYLKNVTEIRKHVLDKCKEYVERHSGSNNESQQTKKQILDRISKELQSVSNQELYVLYHIINTDNGSVLENAMYGVVHKSKVSPRQSSNIITTGNIITSKENNQEQGGNNPSVMITVYDNTQPMVSNIPWLQSLNTWISNYKNVQGTPCTSCGLYNEIQVGISWGYNNSSSNNIDGEDTNTNSIEYACNKLIQAQDTGIDILFIGEAPGEDETKYGMPFVGRAGKVLRQDVIYQLGNVSWVIANTCYCRPPGNRTPKPEEIKLCKPILGYVIGTCKPKQVVLLGDTAVKSNINPNVLGRQGITKLHCKVMESNTELLCCNYKPNRIVLSVHPSYVVRSQNHMLMYSLRDVLTSGDSNNNNNIESGTVLTSSKKTLQSTTNTNVSTSNIIPLKVYHDRIENLCFVYSDDKYYFDPEYSILDVTEVNYSTCVVIYKKRNSDNTVVQLYKISDYCYIPQDMSQGTFVKPAKETNHITNMFEVRNMIQADPNIILYDQDVDFSSKLLVDWKLLRKKKFKDNENVLKLEEQPPQFRYCIIDLECLGEGRKFPSPKEAEYPIVLLTLYSSVDGMYHTYVLSDNEDGIKAFTNQYVDSTLSLTNANNDIKVTYKLHVFKDELTMLEEVVKHIKEHDCVSGWNISFDIGYLWNRIDRYHNALGNYQQSYSSKIMTKIPNGKVLGSLNLDTHHIMIPGMIVVDLLTGYKSISFGERESYSLNYIANLELGLEKTHDSKLGAMFHEIWKNNVPKAIEYNIVDVVLCKLLVDKMDMLNFFNKVRFVSNVSWSRLGVISKLIDGLLAYMSKQEGNVLLRKLPQSSTTMSGRRSIVGGFVHEPIQGLHKVGQFDFSSLYPSIIMSCNIGVDTLYGKFENSTDMVRYYNYLKTSSDEDGKVTIKFNFFNGSTRTYEPRNVSIGELKKLFETNKTRLAMNGCTFSGSSKSFFSKVLEHLIKRRKEEKDLYSKTKSNDHNIKQQVYKLLANSLYGYLGFDKSRFFIPDLAESVTITGQILNKFLSLYVERYGLNGTINDSNESTFRCIEDIFTTCYSIEENIKDREYIVYGDTDSIFITSKLWNDDTNLIPDVENHLNKVVHKFGTVVCQAPSKDSKLKIEYKYMGTMFLTNVKKRYAVYVTHPKETLDVKGLEIKRTDYPRYFKENFEKVLYMLLKERKSLEEISKFIDDVYIEALKRLKSCDLSICKPTVWNKESYKTVTPGVKGMLLFNSLFWDEFTEGSRGMLVQIRFHHQNVPHDKLQKYISGLNQVSPQKVDPQKELQSTKWLVLPHNLTEEDRMMIVDKQNVERWFTFDTNIVETYWINKMADFGFVAG